jgi:hypothetical protein
VVDIREPERSGTAGGCVRESRPAPLQGRCHRVLVDRMALVAHGMPTVLVPQCGKICYTTPDE